MLLQNLIKQNSKIKQSIPKVSIRMCQSNYDVNYIFFKGISDILSLYVNVLIYI